MRVLAECEGNISEAADKLGISRSSLQACIRTAKRLGITTPPPYVQWPKGAPGVAGHKGRIDLEVDDGIILVGSDAHIWPGPPTIAMQAFVWACKFFRPSLRAVILNGDVVDGARISRHPSIGWENKPKLIEELAAVQKQLREIQNAAGDDADYIWTLGNHDSRFETAIANALPEFEHVQGVHLRDHFPSYEAAWSCWVNDDVVIKHRLRSGVHATWNNTIYAGKTIVTGHLHSLAVRPFTDYNGTRWGVDTGTLAAPYGPQFIDYTEANPTQWRAGFVVLTFRDGRLMWPEMVHCFTEDAWEFRGEVYKP